ncbi:hypothetical protein NGM10_13385 [Halorussus salilacus]|uniref:hypothetical protein n=1 Tax=Halorussus salilacus TaxID=2953750 RepID=UPI0020A043D1|nr:hypothetical protein [Halorussus salilacus]USZ67714.1 hypothetical protein NGM10_13385 [Halorussus salilacus]
MSTDARVVRSVAVTTADVVAAYEARERSSRPAVLRVTPPFSGRMRARLHVADGDVETDAIHIDPATLVAEGEVPAYPSPDDTEDELRADPDAPFSVERHRERHVEAVEAWREAVAEGVVDRVELPTDEGTHAVEVKRLG